MHTVLILILFIFARERTEVETEGGGRGREVSLRSFYLTPWDDVKSPTSRPPPTPPPLLTSICRGTCFVWGVGVMTECTHMHAVPPPHPSTLPTPAPSLPPKWRTTDISVFEVLLKIAPRAPKWTTSQREKEIL